MAHVVHVSRSVRHEQRQLVEGVQKRPSHLPRVVMRTRKHDCLRQ